MITDNIQSTENNIKAIAQKVGRSPADITLIAVSKRQPVVAIQEAIKGGHQDFGENFVQEAEEKIKTIGSKATWHFIGRLQSNKAKIVGQLFDVVHTVDRLKIAKALNKARNNSNKLQILIQVNIGLEQQKGGVLPEECPELIKSILPLENLTIIGLMAMPPKTEQAEEARKYFKALKDLSLDLKKQNLLSQTEKIELSMGMSGDFPVAIEEGATIIRVGTAIFGSRP